MVEVLRSVRYSDDGKVIVNFAHETFDPVTISGYQKSFMYETRLVKFHKRNTHTIPYVGNAQIIRRGSCDPQ